MVRFLAVVTICALAAGSGVLADAVLVAPAYRFDFGYAPTGSTLTHHFWLKSIGTDTVVIDEVKTGCACAVSSMDRNWIAPGDSLLLGIEWDVTRYRNAISRAPRIFYNGKPDPIRLSMRASVLDFPDSLFPVSVKPYRLELARTAVKDIDSVEFTMTNRSSEDVNVRLISDIPDCCIMSIPTTLSAGSQEVGRCRIKPEYRDTTFVASVTVQLDDRDKTLLTIPIRRKSYR